MRQKKVIRIDLPETNSSSSHSVVISMDSEKNLNIKDSGLKIDENTKTLYIPQFSDFGREMFYSNSTLIKLEYLSCFFVRGCLAKRVTIGKQIHKFELALKDILGVEHIVFEEVSSIWKGIQEKTISKEDSFYYDFPSIDWQSLILEDEILESPETIKNFLLNPNSWVYGGDDCDDQYSDIFGDTKQLPGAIGYFSADLPGIGRVDIEISADFDKLTSDITRLFEQFVFLNGKFFSISDIDLPTKNTYFELLTFKISSRCLYYGTFNFHGDKDYQEKPPYLVPLKLTLYNDLSWTSFVY